MMAAQDTMTSPASPKLDTLPPEIIFEIVHCILRHRTRCPDLNGHEEEEHLELGYDHPWSSHVREQLDIFEKRGSWQWDRFAAWPWAFAFASTCRRLYHTATPEIYRLDVKYSHASALLISARTGNAAAVRWSLANGAAVDQTDFTLYRDSTKAASWCFSYVRARARHYRHTALHWATIFGHEDIVDILLANGADPNRRESTRTLRIGRGFPLDKFDTCRALTYRMVCDSADEPSDYMRAPCDAAPGVNALFYATSVAVQDWAPALMDPRVRGLYPKVAEEALLDREAVCRSRLRIARKLIDAGSSLVTFGRPIRDAYWPHRWQTPHLHVLHQAAAEANTALLEFLLGDLKLDPNLLDAAGFTPLHYLFQPFPDLSVRRDGPGFFHRRYHWDGVTDSYMLAAERTLEILLAHGADIHHRRRTPPPSSSSSGPPGGGAVASPDAEMTALGRCLAQAWPGSRSPELVHRPFFDDDTAALPGGEGDDDGGGGGEGLPPTGSRYWGTLRQRDKVFLGGALALLRHGASLRPGGRDVRRFVRLVVRARSDPLSSAFGRGRGLPETACALLGPVERARVQFEIDMRRVGHHLSANTL